MENRIKPPHVYVCDTGKSVGRGVFAVRAFFRNEVVEVAPVFLLADQFSSLPNEFQQRVFNWAYLTNSSPPHAIALGYGSMYNHSDTPNLRYEADAEEKVLRFIATRGIDPNEQLTIHYNQCKEGDEPKGKSWFEAQGIIKEVIE